MTDNTLPMLDDIESETDPADLIEAGRIYAQSFALRGALAESATLYGLLAQIETLQSRNDELVEHLLAVLRSTQVFVETVATSRACSYLINNNLIPRQPESQPDPGESANQQAVDEPVATLKQCGVLGNPRTGMHTTPLYGIEIPDYSKVRDGMALYGAPQPATPPQAVSGAVSEASKGVQAGFRDKESGAWHERQSDASFVDAVSVNGIFYTRLIPADSERVEDDATQSRQAQGERVGNGASSEPLRGALEKIARIARMTLNEMSGGGK